MSGSADATSRFGSMLRARRLAANLTQTELAGLLGLSRTYISEMERGRRSISLPMLAVFAKALNVSVSELTRGL